MYPMHSDGPSGNFDDKSRGRGMIMPIVSRVQSLLTLVVFAAALGACSKQLPESEIQAETMDTTYWNKRLSGEWVRIDNLGHYDASGASALTFGPGTLKETSQDGRVRQSDWTVLENTDDVTYIQVIPRGQAAEKWRLYLVAADQLTVFVPNLPPASYAVKGSEAAKEDAAALMRTPPSVVQENAREPREGTSITRPQGSTPTQVQEEEPETVEGENVASPSRSELEKIFSRMKNVHVSTLEERKRLGERLLIGSWLMAPGTLASINEGAQDDAVTFTDVVLRFSNQWRLTMIWKTAGDMTSYGSDWRVEGMYGTEIRVILTDPSKQESREFMKFMDIDHFILDPEGEALMFVRDR